MEDDVKKWIEQDGEKLLKEIGVKKGYVLLDFGSGEGHYTIPASKVVGENGKVYALDKDRAALNKLEEIIKKSKIKNIELIREDSNIPLKNNSLNAALCYDVIHYQNSKKRVAIYNEICRVLKKDGLFSVYPKHYKEDSPSNQLADTDLEDIIKEIEKSGFMLGDKITKTLLHDEYYNEGYILNFRRC